MRNNPFPFWLLLFAYGVFGADGVKSVSVSVMVGDSVTLHTDDTEIQGVLELVWKIQGENKFIAEIDKEINKLSVPGNDEEPFRGRLKLDDQTGSLTITNLTTTDSRVYELQIKNSRETKSKIFNVDVSDVVESVSVMEGDTVTLHTGVTEIQREDKILWKFGDKATLIANLNGAVDGWRNVVYLNDQNGHLTFRNIQSNQHGKYEVEVISSSMVLHRIFRIAFNGVFSLDGVKKMSVWEGNSFTLQTRITDIPGDDVIEWTFGPQNTSIVKTDREKAILRYNEDDVRFTNRLHLDIKTGDLTISNIKTDVAGLYHIKITKSMYAIQKSFSVTVSESGLSLGVVIGIVAAVLLVVAVAAGVIVMICKSKGKSYIQTGQGNST
ncbi:T-lymphocyte surface antigen Ly-9-like [Cyprinus carpio]|uniref:T-lymphocyte surface antigen Ly-9-like n=1 Tax=Cyprinus carpio TaxID=7962 RepID=A0A9R0AN34_CYPCA|nr:T-lymphocyte surface antigen Ly-9-like [Cyprinus carpio]